MMGILEHLEELRTRLIRACLAIGAGMTLAFFNIDRLAIFVRDSMLAALPPGTPLITTKPGEGFAFSFDIALIIGVVLAAPFVLFQVWRFVAPGLYSGEKRLILPFMAMATLGTAGGVLFAHALLFPSTMRFLLSFDLVPAMWRLEDTFAFYRNSLLAMVIVFQLPTLIFFLARMRLVSARWLWTHFKHAVLVSFVAAALFTSSSDPGNQVLMAAPMIALYLVSIMVAWLVRPRDDGAEDRGPGLRLVVSATMLDQALRAGRPSSGRSGRRFFQVR